MGRLGWNGKRTLEHCWLITKSVKAGIGEPRQANGKCDGYAVSRTNDEPCELCKKCRLCTFYEEGE